MPPEQGCPMWSDERPGFIACGGGEVGDSGKDGPVAGDQQGEQNCVR